MEAALIELEKKHSNTKSNIPKKLEGEGTVIKLLDSGGHSAPLSKNKHEKVSFFIPAFK